MFRELIPLLADRSTSLLLTCLASASRICLHEVTFGYTFEHITDVIDRLTEVLGLERFALYVFDYGAPVGFRIATRHPERIAAIISQNGNAYEEGLSDGWKPVPGFLEEPSKANREAIRGAWWSRRRRSSSTPGVLDETRVSPDGYGLDDCCLRAAAPTSSGSTCSSTMRATWRSAHVPGVLPHQQAASAGGVGSNDPFFLRDGRRSLQTQHPRRRRSFRRHRSLRLETHVEEIATAISEFLAQ